MELRLLAAAGLIPVVAGALWQGGVSAALLVGLAGVLAAREYLRLALGGLSFAELPALVALAVLPLVAAHATHVFWAFFAAAVATCLANLARGDVAGGPARIGHASAAMLLIGPPLLAILQLRTRHGFGACLFLLAAVWLNDALAFFVGRAIGTHHFAPRISPHKTLEGLAAGTLGSVAAALVLGPAVLRLALPTALFAGVAIAVAAPLGDLTKSLLKRSVHAKDSGQLIPGHGGVLDRLDSLLFSAPLLLGILELYA